MRLPLLTLLVFSSSAAWAETASAPPADQPHAVHDVASLERAAEPPAGAGDMEREHRRAIANAVYRRLRHMSAVQTAASGTAPADVAQLNATIADLQEALADALRNGRRNAISGAVTLRRTQAILALRNSLTPAGGENCNTNLDDGDGRAAAAQSQAEISALQDDLAKALRDNQRNLASTVYLRRRQSDASNTIATLRVNLTRTGEELTKARATQAETVDAAANAIQLNATIASLRDDLAKAGDELTKARAVQVTSAKIATLEGDLADKSEALTQARASQVPNADATGNIARLNATVADLQKGLNKAQRDTRRAVATAVYQRRQHSDASQLVASLRSDLATTNDELGKARAAEATNTDAAADIVRLNATVADLQIGLNEAQRDTRRAVAAGVHQRQKQSNASQLLAALRSDLATRNDELTKARAAQQATSMATAVNATQLNATITSLRDDLEKSGKALDQARAAEQAANAGAAVSATQHKTTLAELESGLANARRESQRAVANAALQRRRHNEANALIGSLRAVLATSQAELVKTRSTFQAADTNSAANVTRLNATIAKLDAELAIARRDSRRAVATLIHQRQLQSHSSRDAGALQEQLAEREGRVDKLTATVAKLQSDLSDTKLRLQQALADATDPGDQSGQDPADVTTSADESGRAADDDPLVNTAYATESSAEPAYPRRPKADQEKAKASRVREGVVVDRPLPPRRVRWKVLDQYGSGTTSLPRRPRP